MPDYSRHPASYKDPSGFIFQYKENIYRQVNQVYASDFALLNDSGLYSVLAKKNLLIPHEEIKENLLHDAAWFTTLLPEQIPFWTYPYEWCFDQLKDAALLTLELVTLSVEKGMILKDATPYNIQFLKGKPMLIDSLSFEKYDETKPWIAYRQFCENFLNPLLLSHYHKTNFLNQLFIYPDGIPAGLTAKLLPARSNFNLSVLLHVHLSNKLAKMKKASNLKAGFSKKKLTGLISHLKSFIQKLENKNSSTWNNYYEETISGEAYHKAKETVVLNMLQQVKGKKLLDIGANDGFYSLLAAKNGFEVTAIDNDEQSINNLFNKIKTQQISNVLPLCIDISNPSAFSGFSNMERKSFQDRLDVDIVLALALVHHLVIGKNIPFDLIAEYLSKFAAQLIIEFVPKEDEKTQWLLKNRKDIFPTYTKEGFETSFGKYFSIERVTPVAGTERVIYLMNRIINR